MRTAGQIAALLGANSDVRHGNDLLENVNILGVTSNYSDIRNVNVAAGRFLTEADQEHRSPVCFIGADLVKKFFSNVDPIGKTIRAGTHSYEVIGVAAGIGGPLGQSQGNFGFIPLKTHPNKSCTHRNSLALFIPTPNPDTTSS